MSTDDREMAIVLWAIYGLGGLMSWIVDLPLCVALVGFGVASAYWVAGRRLAAKSGGES